MILVFWNVVKIREVSSSHHSFQKRWGQPLFFHLRLFAKICSQWGFLERDTFSFKQSNGFPRGRSPCTASGGKINDNKSKWACLREVLLHLCFNRSPAFLCGVARPSHTEWLPTRTSHHRNDVAQKGSPNVNSNKFCIANVLYPRMPYHIKTGTWWGTSKEELKSFSGRGAYPKPTQKPTQKS